MGAGKIYHGRYGNTSEWDDFLKRSTVSGQDSYVQKDIGGVRWAQLKGDDSAVGDYQTVSYCIRQLQSKHDKPFFIACGIFRPHMPWSVPKKYFDMHPIDEIKLPPHIEDDLEDIPEAGVKTAKPTGDHKRITDAGAWKEAVQALSLIHI